MNQKIIGIIVGVVIALVVIGALGFVYAQQTGNKTNNNPVKGTNFVDVDNDGVCDNAQSGTCPNKNKGNGFVDENNDGVCDNAGNCPMHNSNKGCSGKEACPMKNKAGGCRGLKTPA
jgi:hypothetical protein